MERTWPEAAIVARINERIADHAQTVIDLNELRLLSDEADFLRHEGGPESVAAMEDAMRVGRMALSATPSAAVVGKDAERYLRLIGG